MDPVSQGVVGALAAQTVADKKNLKKAAIIGALAGMAPDLDVLIRSDTDPLLYLEYHRHFTHALLFIPIGALLCSVLFYLLFSRFWTLTYKQVLTWCFLGIATHGLLDACTSYGTQLAWPLTRHRFAWDLISIIDPLFTLPLLSAVLIAAIGRKKAWVYAAVAWVVIYLGFAFIQQQRAETLGMQLAQGRGHEVIRIEAKPSFANLIVWKVVYETPERYYVDAIKPRLTQKSAIWHGDSLPKLDLERDLPWLDKDSQQARDIERFRWFSQGYIALLPGGTDRIGDIRYSLLPHKIEPLWGIELTQDAPANQHVHYYMERNDTEQASQTLLNMIME